MWNGIWEWTKEYITKTSEIRENFLEESYLRVCDQNGQAWGGVGEDTRVF